MLASKQAKPEHKASTLEEPVVRQWIKKRGPGEKRGKPFYRVED
jgi:hypothetical protein